MTDPILSAIEKERRTLQARLATLAAMERAIKKSPRPPGIAVLPPRAPNGLLREVVLKALKQTGPTTSAQLKAHIRKGGYEHPISGQYFTKTLKALVTDREVMKEPNGGYSTYALR